MSWGDQRNSEYFFLKSSKNLIYSGACAHTQATTNPRPAAARGPLLRFSLGLQVPCKSAQANNVYLSRDNHLHPRLLPRTRPSFHSGELPKAQLPQSSYTRPGFLSQGSPSCHISCT